MLLYHIFYYNSTILGKFYENSRNHEKRFLPFNNTVLKTLKTKRITCRSYNNGSQLEKWFDTFSTEQKKIIICELCDRIEVSWDYEVRIVVGMDYGQFCG